MTLKEIAADIIKDHAQDVEFMTILEMYEYLSDTEAEEVLDLITSATVTVAWPEE